MVKCLICERAFTTSSGLGQHIREGHHTTSQQYYDQFFKKPGEGVCLQCGQPTRFWVPSRGYRQYCGYVCRGRATQDKLKSQSGDSDRRRELVKQREAKWAANGLPEGAVRSRKNISEASSEKRAARSRQACEVQTSNAFLRSYIKLITKTLVQKAHKKAYQEDCVKPIKTRQQADFGRYCRRARYWSKKTYREYKHLLNPQSLPIGMGPTDYQTDHIVSLKDCYDARIPEKVSGCSLNLQLLTQVQNSQKNDRSDRPASWLAEQWAERRYTLEPINA